jgi:multidrug resistance efflux pump
MFTTEETDDAFVTTRVHAVGARVGGNVVEVLVQENQPVKRARYWRGWIGGITRLS